MSVIFHFYFIFWHVVAHASGFQSLGRLRLRQKLQREEKHDWEELCIFLRIRSRVAFWAFTADRKGCSSVTEWTFSLNAWNKQQLFGWFGAVQMSFNGTLGVDEKAPPVREYSPLMARTLRCAPKVKMQQLSWHFRRQTAGLHPRKTCLTFEGFFYFLRG